MKVWNKLIYRCFVWILLLFISGVTHCHLSDHMSEVVETTLNDLQQSKVSKDLLVHTHFCEHTGKGLPCNAYNQMYLGLIDNSYMCVA